MSVFLYALRGDTRPGYISGGGWGGGGGGRVSWGGFGVGWGGGHEGGVAQSRGFRHEGRGGGITRFSGRGAQSRGFRGGGGHEVFGKGGSRAFSGNGSRAKPSPPPPPPRDGKGAPAPARPATGQAGGGVTRFSAGGGHEGFAETLTPPPRACPGLGMSRSKPSPLRLASLASCKGEGFTETLTLCIFPWQHPAEAASLN